MGIDKQEFQRMAPMLRKVREHLGFSLKEAADLLEPKLETPPTKFDSPELRLQAWEEARDTPTFRQIKILFEKVYRYPYMVLAYDELPKESFFIKEYRRDDAHSPSANERRILRVFEEEIQSRQDLLRDIAEEEEWPVLDFIGSCSLQMGPAAVAFKMRELLNYPYPFETKDDLVKTLRNKLEDLGIFVFYKNNLGQSTHTSTKIDYSGLALSDEKVPVICVNHDHDDSRKLFTLIHEFCHLLLGEKAVSDFNVFQAEFSSDKIEKFCNDVASEFFITDEELEKSWNSSFSLKENIAVLTEKFPLSKMAIVVRLRKNNYISYEEYQNYYLWHKKICKNKKERQRERSGGPNYYIKLKSYLGLKFIHTIAHAYYSEQISYTLARDVLHASLEKLLEEKK